MRQIALSLALVAGVSAFESVAIVDTGDYIVEIEEIYSEKQNMDFVDFLFAGCKQEDWNYGEPCVAAGSCDDDCDECCWSWPVGTCY